MLLKPQAYFGHVRKHLFGGTLNQGQVDGIYAILHAWDLGDGSLNRLAYVLATPIRETDSAMQPITEYGPQQSTAIGKRLGNIVAGDGNRYRCRGQVMITGRRNYRFAREKLGIPRVVDCRPLLIKMVAGALEGLNLTLIEQAKGGGPGARHPWSYQGDRGVAPLDARPQG